jgi:hypothetical protein
MGLYGSATLRGLVAQSWLASQSVSTSLLLRAAACCWAHVLTSVHCWHGFLPMWMTKAEFDERGGAHALQAFCSTRYWDNERSYGESALTTFTYISAALALERR